MKINGSYKLNLPGGRDFTVLVFDERVPLSRWSHVLIDGRLLKPAIAMDIADNSLVFPGLFDPKNLEVEFV